MKPVENQVKNVTILPNVESILGHYEGFLLDVWGVVHDGHTAFPNVVPFINRLISEQYPILFVSNAPRPAAVLIGKLQALGIQVTSEMMLSSGDLLRTQLMRFNDTVFEKLKSPAYHLGEERNQDILSGMTLKTTEHLTEANFVLLTAYLDEEENLRQHDQTLEKALALQLPFICANPDKAVPHGSKLRYCAGVLAEQYEKMGGEVHYYGKPFPAIFECAIQIFKERGIKDRKKILMIGDTLETDILGAKNVGIDSALVLTGNGGSLLGNTQTRGLIQDKENQNKSKETEKAIAVALRKIFEAQNIYPTWILSRLA